MHSTRITHPSSSRDIIEDGQSASEFIHVELPGKKNSSVYVCVLLLSEKPAAIWSKHCSAATSAAGK